MFNFKKEINLYSLIWIFMLGSFLGYLIEMFWCFIKNGYFESRQRLLYGPFSPVYGIGSMLFFLFLYKFKKQSKVKVFCVSFLIGGIFEYICSIVQQNLVGTISWDYSENMFSIHGRTNLIYCIFWGILGIIFIKKFYPLFNRFIHSFRLETIKLTTLFILIIMIPNIILSILSVRREVARINKLPPSNNIDTFLDKHYPESYLKEIFPNMIFPETK